MKNESDSSLSPKPGSRRKQRAGAERADRSSRTAAARSNRLYGKFAQDGLMATVAPTQVNEAKTDNFDANKSSTNNCGANKCGAEQQSNQGLDDPNATEASPWALVEASDTADGENLIRTDFQSRQDYSASNFVLLASAVDSVPRTVNLSGTEELQQRDLQGPELEAQQFVIPFSANLQNADQSVVMQLDLPTDKQIRFAHGAQTVVYLTFSARLANDIEGRATTKTEKGTNDNPQIAIGKFSPAVQSLADESAKLRSFLLTGKLPDRRYILGTEIALAAVIASAGVARARGVTNKKSGDDGEFPSNNQLSVEQRKRIFLDSGALKTTGTERKGSTRRYVILRTVDPSIGAFAINSECIEQILLPKRRPSGATIARSASPPRQGLRRRTVMVSENDTLEIIAERYLFDASLAPLVADVNRHNIKQTYIDGKRVVELKFRQQLIMPVRREIADFYSRPLSERQEDLVTIVEVSQIDRQLISTILGPVVNANPSQIATKNMTSPRPRPDPGRDPKKQSQ